MSEIHWIIFISSFVLMLLAIGYIATIAFTNRRIISEQSSKLTEIRKREEQYRSLFNNTVVGMLHFLPGQWSVLEVNQTLLDIMELPDKHSLQNIFPELMYNPGNKILAELGSTNGFTDQELNYTSPSGKLVKLLFSGRQEGSDNSVHAVMIDITEKRRLEESFIRAQKIEALSILTGSIVHDLQNIFAPIQLSLKLLEQQTRSQRVKKILKATKGSVIEGQKLVNNILSIAKGAKKEFKPVHINGLFRSIIQSFRVGKNIELRFHNNAKRTDPIVNGNENQLKQLFLNLLRNSSEAIVKKGYIDITIVSTAKEIAISVSDNGLGIPADERAKVFEPFYTTKKDSGGTGLGLAIVAEIVKQHSGAILIESSEPNGTIMTITLPLSVRA